MDREAVESVAARLARIAASWPQLSADQTRALAVCALELEYATGKRQPGNRQTIRNDQPR